MIHQKKCVYQIENEEKKATVLKFWSRKIMELSENQKKGEKKLNRTYFHRLTFFENSLHWQHSTTLMHAISLSLGCVLQNVSTENENINSCFMRYFLIGEKKIGTNIRQNTCMPHSSKMFYTEDGIFNNHSKTWLCCHLSVSAGFCVAVCCFVATFDCVNLIWVVFSNVHVCDCLLCSSFKIEAIPFLNVHVQKIKTLPTRPWRHQYITDTNTCADHFSMFHRTFCVNILRCDFVFVCHCHGSETIAISC